MSSEHLTQQSRKSSLLRAVAAVGATLSLAACGSHLTTKQSSSKPPATATTTTTTPETTTTPPTTAPETTTTSTTLPPFITVKSPAIGSLITAGLAKTRQELNTSGTVSSWPDYCIDWGIFTPTGGLKGYDVVENPIMTTVESNAGKLTVLPLVTPSAGVTSLSQAANRIQVGPYWFSKKVNGIYSGSEGAIVPSDMAEIATSSLKTITTTALHVGASQRYKGKEGLVDTEGNVVDALTFVPPAPTKIAGVPLTGIAQQQIVSDRIDAACGIPQSAATTTTTAPGY